MIIREMREDDRERVASMMHEFYASEAVLTDGSPEIFKADIDACVGDSPYLEGYIFEEGSITIGYGMLAKSFSTEFGKPCIWVEDLYLENEHRAKGFGSQFLRFVQAKYNGALLRLEVEADNEIAIKTYRKCGFEVLPYMEMKK